jgi:hypothetical protein
MCRRSTGGLFSIGVFFNWSDFRMVKGEPDYYRATELGRYAFCRNCGSTIYGAYDGSPSLYVYLGGLDNPDDWPFDAEGWSGHVFVDDKVSWYEINDGLPQHAASAGYYDASRRNITSVCSRIVPPAAPVNSPLQTPKIYGLGCDFRPGVYT